ncbi:MAG: DUF3574 domain-containing protein [Thermomicrobiales bacterium]|nr:DUF3574 domain-containing protein [Thermomicrobiales bacterium]
MAIEPMSDRSVRGRLSRRAQGLAVAALLLAGGASIGIAPAALDTAAAPRAQNEATPVAVADACPDELYGPGSEPWVRADLFFGTTNPDTGQPWGEKAWLNFLDTEVTPRFPDGLTVLTGLGQWRGESGVTSQEESKVLIILFPSETAQESSALLEEIRAAYKEQFKQQSVLRTDIANVCTSF